MYQAFREFWNRPNCGKGPYRYFAGVLRPIALDKNGDVVYEFDYDRAGITRKTAQTATRQANGLQPGPRPGNGQKRARLETGASCGKSAK
jgi:hypothetical protein